MYKIIKRIIDILVSTIILILLSPIFIFITIILMVSFKGNPFFVQPRPGKNEKIFNLIKFKTMTDETDENNKLLPDAQRITKIGKFLRDNSLDELPQFFNVLKGDMSLVGPRPLLVKYLPRYTKKQARRHEVKPGITGLSQINGRNKLTWEERFELDVYYVDNYSFIMDLKILLLTLIKVFRKDGINYSERITMTPFQGTQNSVRDHNH